MPKAEKVSLEEAAEALVALHDSGNYNNRRYNRIFGLFRDAVKEKGSNTGPIMPDDERPELDEEQEQAVEERVWTSARVDDLVHPGGRLQSARESVDTILKKAKEGTLAEDEARRTARLAKGEDPDGDGAKPSGSNRPRAQRKRQMTAKKAEVAKQREAAKTAGKTDSVSTTGSTGS